MKFLLFSLVFFAQVGEVYSLGHESEPVPEAEGFKDMSNEGMSNRERLQTIERRVVTLIQEKSEAKKDLTVLKAKVQELEARLNKLQKVKPKEKEKVVEDESGIQYFQ